MPLKIFIWLLLCKQCIKDNLSHGGKSGSRLIFWYRAYPWLLSGWVLSKGALVLLSYCTVLVLGSISASWFILCKGWMNCLQAEQLSFTCSGVPQALPPQVTLLGATWGSQVPLQCCRCPQCTWGHCEARDCHLPPLPSLRCPHSFYGHVWSSPVYSELQSQPQGLPYRQPGRAAGQMLPHHCISERHREQPVLKHPTCACQSQHRKAILREKQPFSSPFTSVTSSVSDQIPSFALETFQNSPNLCKFSVCLFLSLWWLAIFSSSY